MKNPSKYVSKEPNSNGLIDYTNQENETWDYLVKRQDKLIKNRACLEFIEGVQKLSFNEKIPQHQDVSAVLRENTGWAVEPVAAIIPAQQFFELLANKKFPCANFIRTPEEIDYLKEPDIFHEVYGHCPLLTHESYANYVQEYGKIASKVDGKIRMRLFRLFWYTIEFGLLKENNEYRAYGGGILSSSNETVYSIDSDVPERVDLENPMVALRTPYKIDILQPTYFALNKLEDLYKLLEFDLVKMAKESIELGNLPKKF